MLSAESSLPLQREKTDKMPKRKSFADRITSGRSSSTAIKNAAEWNRPGGGYDKWKAGDAQREKDLPVGGMAPLQAKPLEEKKPLEELSNKLLRFRRGEEE